MENYCSSLFVGRWDVLCKQEDWASSSDLPNHQQQITVEVGALQQSHGIV